MSLCVCLICVQLFVTFHIILRFFNFRFNVICLTCSNLSEPLLRIVSIRNRTPHNKIINKIMNYDQKPLQMYNSRLDKLSKPPLLMVNSPLVTTNVSKGWTHREICYLLSQYERNMDSLRYENSKNNFWVLIAELMQSQGYIVSSRNLRSFMNLI